jgi:hypothetical protein
MNSEYSTIRNFVRKYPDFLSESSIRNLIFNEDLNGFSACIRRVGRRILLKDSAVFEWIEQRGSKGGRHA